MYRLAFVALSLCLAVPAAALADDRPSREERLKMCKADIGTGKTNCFPAPKAIGPAKFPTNLNYGWYVGKGHPIDEANPPPYHKLLNGLDQCAWFHDRAAWRWNPHTRFCEGQNMCANTLGLMRCVEAYQPETPEEVEAKRLITKSPLSKLPEACIRKLYKSYGDEFKKDSHGSMWMTDKSLNELSEAFSHCKPLQPLRGFEAELARLKRGADFKPKK
jgi:hypothetical protein